jgi:hypothetical protein
MALALYGHNATAAVPDGYLGGSQPLYEGAAVRNLAAAWVAAQVGRTTIVSADPQMCRALESHGVPARDLFTLGPQAIDPLRSAIIVATPIVRDQFGKLLSSVYAPKVLASFGSGRLRIDIREVARRGAAAYRSTLGADLAARTTAGTES